MGNYNVCGQYPGLVSQGATVKLQCEKTDLQPARYVIVQLPIAEQFPAKRRMRLCELEVYTVEGLVAYRFLDDTASLHITSTPVVVLSIAMSMSVCLSAHISQVKSKTSGLYESSYTCKMWPCLVPPLTTLQFLTYFHFCA